MICRLIGVTALCLCTLVIPKLSAVAQSAQAQSSGSSSNSTSPTVITAGEDWIPLKAELDILPGSALDFSHMGLADAPAGKHGRVLARADGQFAFQDSPAVARRFYGVNLCFGAQYLPKDEADKLAERLSRFGYNAIRIHHYEGDLIRGQGVSTKLNPEKIDQLDYLLAAFIRRGIYITTDLFVSRPVPYAELGIDKPGNVPMDTFKILVPVHPRAFENWKAFATSLLTHTNSFTGRRYADEPALAWLAMINEGNFGNFYKDIQTIPEWKSAWNQWLVKHYPNRAAMEAVWAGELAADELPAQGSVKLPGSLNEKGLRTRDCVLFLAETERNMVSRMKAFLHDEIGCRALISNSSSWTRFTTDQGTRTVYDYVDDHFYVDHPQWVESPWRLPSKCPNSNPLQDGAPGGRNITLTRLFDKPFTCTEYNYSGPGRFRAMGGILTGALGAIQGWGGIWRFAYSHSEKAMFSPSPMGYFDVASDPLSQAGERASLCLFLRGDLRPAEHKVTLVMTEADLAKPAAKIPTLAPRWHWLAWNTRVGTQVIPSAQQAPKDGTLVPLAWSTPAKEYNSSQVLDLAPYSASDADVADALGTKGILTKDISRPTEKYYRSDTGEITIDGPRAQFVLDTPRTAGGYGAEGQVIETKAGVLVRIKKSEATVWVSSLDDAPIKKSKRLLVTHLTDLQNSDIKYKEAERRTLLNWGQLPHLVKAGAAEVSLDLGAGSKFKVWTLSPSGRRIAEIPVHGEKGALVFTADVGADRANGARMLYEVVEE
jgi:hypothetical protein